jgi:CTP:phosphocholine cytidylyltransferase-like protein
MGTITINIKYSNNEDVPTSSLQYSLRTNILDSHNWVNSNVFESLNNGTYYYSVRRKSDNVIISQGSQVISTSSLVGNFDEPYETTVSGLSEITVLKSQHLKTKVKNVLVFDSNGWCLVNNWQKIDDETVLIVIGEPKTVNIRIS